MQKWAVDLGKAIKGKREPHAPGVEIGTVLTGLPALSVSVGEDIILEAEQLILAEQLFRMHTHTGETVVPVSLAPGDRVILMPTVSQQIYCVIDKVGG